MSVRMRKWKKKGKDGKETLMQSFVVSFTFKHPDGRRQRIREVAPVTTKRAAEQYEQQIRQALLDGTYGRKESTTPTVAEFVPRFIEGYAKANQQKPSTILAKEAIFETYLTPRVGTRRLDELNEEDIQRIKADLRHLAPKTVNNVLSTLNTMLKQAVEWNVIEQRPTVRLLKAPKTEVAFYEPEEYERLVAASTRIDPRIGLMVLLGGDAGLRCGEIIALEWRDLDVKRGAIKVQRSEWIGHVTVPKSGRTRQVKMTERLALALEAHRHTIGPRVLCRDGGDRVTREVLSGWMSKAQRAAGLRATGTLHILRHTFCSRLAVLGAPTMAIKELAGHQDIKTTQRYMHLSPAAKDSAIALLDRATTGMGKPTETETDTTKT